MNLRTRAPSRRHVLAGAGAALLAAPPRIAIAETAKLKLGLMLPYTGTYAQLGDAITDGLKLAIAEASGRLGGREVEFSILDDESEPSKAPENANKLVNREKVDFLIGTVHSGVEMAMVKVARDTGTMLIIPNAGVGAATGALCAPNIFRTSFSNWQPAFPMGKVVADRGLKRAVTLTWQYAAGEESVGGFREGFTAAGGTILKELWLPFPNVEFQPLLTEIAALKPDVVYRRSRPRARHRARRGARRSALTAFRFAAELPAQPSAASFGSLRCQACCSPAIPSGRANATAITKRPIGNSQCVVSPEMKSRSRTRTKAPIAGPSNVPIPPRTTMTSTSPERCQLRISGLTKPNCAAER